MSKSLQEEMKGLAESLKEETQISLNNGGLIKPRLWLCYGPEQWEEVKDVPYSDWPQSHWGGLIASVLHRQGATAGLFMDEVLVPIGDYAKRRIDWHDIPMDDLEARLVSFGFRNDGVVQVSDSARIVDTVDGPVVQEIMPLGEENAQGILRTMGLATIRAGGFNG